MRCNCTRGMKQSVNTLLIPGIVLASATLALGEPCFPSTAGGGPTGLSAASDHGPDAFSLDLRLDRGASHLTTASSTLSLTLAAVSNSSSLSAADHAIRGPQPAGGACFASDQRLARWIAEIEPREEAPEPSTWAAALFITLGALFGLRPRPLRSPDAQNILQR